MKRADLPPALRHMPICPHRELPIPYIAEVGDDGTGHFTVLDPQRQAECYRLRLCAMCGRPMRGEVALIGDVVSVEPGGFYIEPPVHEQCGELALGGLCPFLSGERVPRRPVEQDGSILLLGSTEELELVGRQIAKRPTAMGIYRGYRMAMHMGTATGAGMPVFMGTERPVRVRLWRWEAGRAAEVPWPGQHCPVRPASPQRASGERTQPKRTSRAGRRSNPGRT